MKKLLIISLLFTFAVFANNQKQINILTMQSPQIAVAEIIRKSEGSFFARVINDIKSNISENIIEVNVNLETKIPEVGSSLILFIDKEAVCAKKDIPEGIISSTFDIFNGQILFKEIKENDYPFISDIYACVRQIRFDQAFSF